MKKTYIYRNYHYQAVVDEQNNIVGIVKGDSYGVRMAKARKNKVKLYGLVFRAWNRGVEYR